MPRNQYVKMELPIQVVSMCLPCTIVLCLCAQNCAASNIHRQLVEIFGENVMSWEMVRQWVHQFCNKEWCNVDDLACEGHPRLSLTSDSIAGVRALHMDDWQLMIWQLECLMAMEMRNPILCNTIYRIVKDELAMRKISALWVPYQLSDEHINQ